MKLPRRSFFSALVGVPAAVAVAAAVPEKIGPPLESFGAMQDRRTLIHDAHVALGTIRVGCHLSASAYELSERILRDRYLNAPNYAEAVLYAASILAPFYAQTLGRGFYAIRKNVGLIVT